MFRYRTVRKEAEAEWVVDRSRFIAHIRPVGSREEADAFIASVRAARRDAAHNVPVFIIGEKSELLWASDDGEPSGTAGPPILQFLSREGLTNVALVVTRYFGGIKLGTGGLVRAYTEAARRAIEAAGIGDMHDMVRLRIRLDYPFYGKLQNMAAAGGFTIRDERFDEAVSVTVITESEHAEALRQSLQDLTAGTCEFLSVETVVDYT